MNLIDALSQEDKDTIQCFIESACNCTLQDINVTLAAWAKNKKRLYKILGNQLRVSFPIDVEMSTQQFFRGLRELYQEPFFSLYPCINDGEIEKTNYYHVFISDLIYFLEKNLSSWYKMPENLSYVEECNYRESVPRGINYLFSYRAVGEKHQVVKEFCIIRPDGKKLEIKLGTKIMRAVRKFCEFVGYNRMDLFEKWRDDVSVLSTVKRVQGKMVISIHPIDILTLSDNNSNWSSCLSWVRQGAFWKTALEMLNSNCMAVVYLESSSKKYYFNNYPIPNKSWRQNLFITKDLLLCGKSYPYYSESMSKAVLDYAMYLCEKNIGRTYQYKKQLYKDMSCLYESYCKPEFLDTLVKNCKTRNKKKIIILMNSYYNDFVHDHSEEYWCCRNYVPHTKIYNLSGSATCVMCGRSLSHVYMERNSRMPYTDYDTFDYMHTYGQHCICGECMDTMSCNCCGHVKNQKLYEISLPDSLNQRICKDCFNGYFYDPKQKLFLAKERYFYLNRMRENSRNPLSNFDRPGVKEYIVDRKRLINAGSTEFVNNYISRAKAFCTE